VLLVVVTIAIGRQSRSLAGFDRRTFFGYRRLGMVVSVIMRVIVVRMIVLFVAAVFV
jgi:hypothetical protein